MSDRQRITSSSGNVFADLGLADPDILLAKAELARQIVALIRAKKLTQTRAAEILGIDQPKVSHLMRGRLDLFSSERLIQFLTCLDADVTITVTTKESSRSTGRVVVRNEMTAVAPHRS
jgi:predicted XRE-type DNA-binding protein